MCKPRINTLNIRLKEVIKIRSSISLMQEYWIITITMWSCVIVIIGIFGYGVYKLLSIKAIGKYYDTSKKWRKGMDKRGLL